MALDDVRILEFTHMVAGPACGQVLGDLGANVVKVEPRKGDITRHLGPPAGGASALFTTTNRNKKSVRLDIRDPGDAGLARRLARMADVVVCNIDGAALSAAGIDFDGLAAENPGLIWVDVTAFGLGGALGTDGIAQAAAGLMRITGAPDGEGYRTGASIVDVSTGIWAALGVMAALENRRRTGRGDRLSVSLADTCLYMQYSQIGMYAADPASVFRNGNHSMISCTPMFQAADGRIMVTILHDRHWKIICDLLGRSDLIDDPRFGTNDQRCRNQTAMEEQLNSRFRDHDRARWARDLRAHRIPCGAERDYGEILADAALWDEGTLFRLPADEGGSVQVASPLRFRDHPPGPRRPAPDLGADQDDILAGLSDAPDMGDGE